MKNRYKIIISNKKIYKEVEVPADVQKMTIGTGINCDVRLYKELFFEQFELTMRLIEGEWQLFCSDNVYISTGDVLKNAMKKLVHGDEFYIKYHDSEGDILKMSFTIDFGFEKNDYERAIDISSAGEVHIGGNEKCQIRLNSPYIGKDYFTISKKGNGYVLREHNTKYGVYVNGMKKTGDVAIHNTDFVAMAEFSFYIKGRFLYTSKNPNIAVNGLKMYDVSNSKSKHQYPHFNRTTRLRTVIPDEKVTVLDPNQAPAKPTGNIVMQLLPALIMLVVTILFRVVLSDTMSGGSFIWISLISMTLGIVTSTVSIIDSRKKYKKDVAERETTYRNYIDKKRAEIEEYRQKEKEILDNTYYSIDEEIQIVNDFTSELFEREVDDKDFLEVRLGTGLREAVRKVEYKKQEKYEGQDELTVIPERIAEEYKMIASSPITVDLKAKNAVGFVGNRSDLYGMLKNITIDISTRQYYKDVNLFYILSDEYQDDFKWLRFLPHVQNEALGIRNIVCDGDSKNILFEYLYKELTRRSSDPKLSYTKLVVFVYNDLGLKRHPISRFIEQAKELDVTFIFFDEHRDYMPSVCDDVIELSDAENGKVILAENSLVESPFVYKAIDTKSAERIAVKLAPVYCDEVSLEGTLTKNITMFEMLNILNADDIDLEHNWRTSMVYKSLAAPLGVKAKGQIVNLDLNEKKHGPHGLVAGTTGSGKSEILQSYILSMATLFHPYEVGFVIIDFKGGGMVNQFKDLPHLTGAITNIDGREINRSLLSIKAELKKRQAIFAEYGVNHVDSYIKLFKKGEAKIPLPHLILIVDEFAELKMDQPEFMKELISAARIGRSLGIHLILATQKPSGVVDAQIWSNSKFKLCLKVQNKEDSNEVLKTPLAAEIKEPGRAYLQVGNNEIFDLFQSAYSGGPASAEDVATVKKFDINRVSLSGRKTTIYSQRPEKTGDERETQLDAIVKHVAKYCKEKNIERLPGICLPPLAEVYNYSHAKPMQSEDNSFCIPMGIFDDPNTQRQDQVFLNVSENNTFILGSSQFGKTSMLQTIIRGLAQQYTPDDVNIYILDFASMALKVFDSLKHVGGVLVPGEDDKIKLFFKMMTKEVKQRKERFSQIGITSYQSYREAGYKDLPQIVILLDNMVAFRELCDAYDEVLLNLCREGVAVGISINVTAQQVSGIGYKYLSAFGNKYGLTCNDKSEYGSLYDRCRMEPKNVPGRSLVSIDKVIYEFQTYLGFEGEKEIQRVEAIKKFIDQRNAECGDSCARRIPEVPATLTGKYMIQSFGKPAKTDYYVGIDFDTVEPVSISTMKDTYIAISGKENAGRSNYIKYLFSCMQKDIFNCPVEAYVIDNFEQKLSSIRDYPFVEKYTTDASEFELMVERFEAKMEKRMAMCAENGVSALEDEPLLVMVVNNAGVYDASKITKDTCNIWKNIVKSSRGTKVLLIMAAVENASVGISASEILKYIKENKNLLFFDELANIKLTDVPAAVQRQFKQSLEQGDAFYVTTAGVMRVRTPLCEEE